MTAPDATAPGERDLARLIGTMTPVLDRASYVFVSVADPDRLPRAALMTFREGEGVTGIVEAGAAQAAGLTGAFPCRRITLAVHSSLDAVGFLAAITACLAAAGIGVNPVAGYHHDHLFVPEARAEEALGLLRTMAAEASG